VKPLLPNVPINGTDAGILAQQQESICASPWPKSMGKPVSGGRNEVENAPGFVNFTLAMQKEADR